VIGFEKIVNGSAKEFFRPLSTPKLLNINFSTVENQLEYRPPAPEAVKSLSRLAY
jgi:hypothetical protein